MATSRNEHLRFRYGICLNDKCEKSKSQEIQEIPARKDFICSECGKPLRECKKPQTFWEKNGKWIIAAILGLVIAAAIVFVVLFNNKEDKKTTPSPVVTPPVEVVEEVKDEKPEAVEEDTADIGVVLDEEEVEGKQVRTIDKGEEPVIPQPKAKEPTKANTKTNNAQASSSGKKLSYGYYDGAYPTGIGTITLSTDYTFQTVNGPVRASKKDRVVGAKFKDGRLTQGELHRQDGTREPLFFGAY